MSPDRENSPEWETLPIGKKFRTDHTTSYYIIKVDIANIAIANKDNILPSTSRRAELLKTFVCFMFISNNG